jgi:hypothetical protein
MKRYQDLTGESGVTGYEILADAIAVQFENGAVYLYDYAVTGREDVEKMQRLAAAGQGLSTYISRFVKERYAKKLR